MIEALSARSPACRRGCSRRAVQPVLYVTGQMRYQEQGYDATEWFLLGAIQVLVLWARAASARSAGAGRTVDRPPRHARRRRSTRCCIAWASFRWRSSCWCRRCSTSVRRRLRAFGFTPFNLDSLWPGVTDVPLVTFLLYLLVLDFVDYWMHRGQHAFRWWWALHAVHHAQQQMSLWTDDRNHLLDDVLQAVLKAAVALAIGVEPAQFVMLIIATRMLAEPAAREHRVDARPGGPAAREPALPPPPPRHRRRPRGAVPRLQLRGAVPGVGPAVRHRRLRSRHRADRHPRPAAAARRPRARLRRGFWAQQWLGLQRLFNPAGVR